LLAVTSDADFEAGRYDTEFVARRHDLLKPPPLDDAAKRDLATALSALAASEQPRREFAESQSSSVSPWVLAERARLR
jgi:hypothetical protein